MNEWQLTATVALRLFVVAVFVMFYVVGGRRWKWVRRFLGGFFLVLATVAVSLLTGTFSWWYFIAFLPLQIGLFMGYGAPDHDFGKKVLRRGTFGAVLGLTGLLLGIMNAAPVLGTIQFLGAFLGSVLIGVTNEQVAVNEEAMIALLATGMLPFLV